LALISAPSLTILAANIAPVKRNLAQDSETSSLSFCNNGNDPHSAGIGSRIHKCLPVMD
jgi:hypothetical protein